MTSVQPRPRHCRSSPPSPTTFSSPPSPSARAIQVGTGACANTADKICDQISDAVVDACLQEDPFSKVACETAVKNGMVLLFGEITSHAKLDYQAIVRDTIKQIGYVDSDAGKRSARP